jgi:hypothetical protein
MAKYGKDKPENFISGALSGGGAPPSKDHGYQDSSQSNEIVDYHVDRLDQKIKTAFAMDNVGRVYDRYPTSMKDMDGIAGGITNLEHSLKGTSAVQEKVGAAGKTKETIIPNH